MKTIFLTLCICILFSAELCWSDDSSIVDLYQNHQSDVQVAGTGVVIKVLPDDLDGSRHQRFILRLAAGHTLLVAHNIDLAPRLDSLAAEDTVEFYGEYEWNAKGGVIHWTHRDPNNRHVGGWLRYNGKKYE